MIEGQNTVTISDEKGRAIYTLREEDGQLRVQSRRISFAGGPPVSIDEFESAVGRLQLQRRSGDD